MMKVSPGYLADALVKDHGAHHLLILLDLEAEAVGEAD
jgi:hypothetical protein